MVKVKGANALLGAFVHKVPPAPRADLHAPLSEDPAHMLATDATERPTRARAALTSAWPTCAWSAWARAR